MKKIFHHLPLLGLGLLCACANPEPVLPQAEAPAATPYTLTSDEALARLEATLHAFDGQTRAPRTVDCIEALRIDEAATRSVVNAPDNAAPVGYVANFEGGGYAILSADSRKAPVVAFAPQGSLSAAEFAQACRLTAAGANEVSTPAYIQALIGTYLATPVTGDVPATRAGESAIVEEQTAFVRTRWTDSAPYNMAIPNHGSAGIPNIAIAQLLIYNHRIHGVGPTTLNIYVSSMHGFYNPDWPLLDVCAYHDQLPADSDNGVEAALLVAAIARANGTVFHGTQTRTSIDKIVTFLTDVWGYDIAQAKPLTTTSLNIIKQKLRTMIYTEKMPAYFQATTYSGMIQPAWLADGWMVLSANNQRSSYIHCNFCVGEQYDLWLLFESATPFSVLYPYPDITGNDTADLNKGVNMIYYYF